MGGQCLLASKVVECIQARAWTRPPPSLVVNYDGASSTSGGQGQGVPNKKKMTYVPTMVRKYIVQYTVQVYRHVRLDEKTMWFVSLKEVEFGGKRRGCYRRAIQGQ